METHELHHTIEEFLNPQLENSFLKNTSRNWRTEITNVIPFLDSVQFSVVRPDCGTNEGGIACIKDEEGELIASVKVPGENSPVDVTIQNSSLDFESESYLLEYGPDQIDQNVNAYAASVELIQAQPQNYQSSSITGLNNSNSHILSRYFLPDIILESGANVRIYAVEGDQLQDAANAIEGTILELNDEDMYAGTALLEFSQGTLERGKTYTVCMNVYSWKREIAGYCFTF